MAAAANATGHAVEGVLNFEAAPQVGGTPRPIRCEERDTGKKLLLLEARHVQENKAMEQSKEESEKLQLQQLVQQKAVEVRNNAPEQSTEESEQLQMQRLVQCAQKEVEERDKALKQGVQLQPQQVEERDKALERSKQENQQLEQLVHLARKGVSEKEKALEQARQESEQVQQSQENAQLEQSLQHVQHEVQQRKKASQKDTQDNEQLQQSLQSAQQEVRERNKALQEATQDNAQLQQSLQSAQQEVQERDGALQKATQENEQLQQSLQRSQQEAQEKDTALEKARQENEQLQQSLQHSQHEVQGRDEAVEEARRENKQLQRNVHRVQQEMKEMDMALEKARQKNEQLQRSVQLTRQGVQERDEALEQARQENEQLQRSVQHSQQEVEKRGEALEKARQENEQLQRSVQLSQQEVEKRGEALEKARQENEELQQSVRRARLEVLENDNRLVRLEASEMQHVQEKEKALGLAKRKAQEQHEKSLQVLEKLHAQEMQKAKQKHDELEQAWWEDWWRWKRWAEEKEQEREQLALLLETKDKVVQEAQQEIEQFQLQWATSSGQIGWQYDSGAKWANFTPEASMSMLEALLRGDKECTIQENGIEYIEDLEKLSQLNPRTGRTRSIRCNCGIPEHWCAKNEDMLRNLCAGSAWCKSFDAVMHEITDPVEHSRIETLLQDSVFHHVCCTAGGACDQMKNCRVVKVWHVENLMLYRRYSGFRSSMQEEHTRRKVQAELISPAVGPELAAFAQRVGVSPVQTSLNEALLFHGTSWETALEIAKEGFDSRLAKDGYWGRGTYFASQSCKSFQYSKPETSGERTVILSRVALGRPYYVTEVQRDLQRPPKRENDSLRCDSVVARPGLMGGHQRGFQTHQEFVIYETAQSYPEFVVRYI